MPTDPSIAAPEISYDIHYQVFLGKEYNDDFRGKGRVVFHPDRPTVVFSGRRRAVFIAGKATEAEFSGADIYNVAVSGRQVRFNTRDRFVQKPFIFFCRDAQTALEVARMLPQHAHDDPVARQQAAEAHDFAARLNAVPQAGSPWTSITNLLIALNVGVFIVMGLLGAGWIVTESMMPYFLYGANNGAATTDGEWWRLVTCMFMHYGLVHLALNMWALYQVGHLLERLLGRTLYTLAYLGSGVIASLASILWHGDKIWSAGASGAVFGAYGALLGYLMREKHSVPPGVFQPLLRSTLTFAGYNIFYGMVQPQIDNAAHVGGLLGGLILGWLIALPLDPSARRQLFPKRLLAGLAVVVALVAAGIALTSRFDYNPVDDFRLAEVLNDELAAKENSLLTRQQNESREYDQTGANGATFARWIGDEVIPFYEPLVKRLESLPLTTGKLTARRRDVVVQFMKLQLEGYRHLQVGVRDKNQAELKSFQDLDQRAAAELGKMPKAKK